MYLLGSNVERIVSLVDGILANASIDVPNRYDLNMMLLDDHVTNTIDRSYVTNVDVVEKSNVRTVVAVNNRLAEMKREMDTVILKVKRIDSVLYTKKEMMHNSVGSPYCELYRLQNLLNTVVGYQVRTEYIGEYLIQLMHVVDLMAQLRSAAVDAKWAVIQYADYLERGFNYLQQQDPDTTK